MDVFLTTALLEKLRAIINLVLHERDEKCVSITELEGVIILYILASSSGSSYITEP